MMSLKDIDSFFINLSQEIKKPTTIILTGGAAALILGGQRPTLDIDFSIHSKNTNEEIQKSILVAEQKTQIKAQYSDNIDRWSMISFLDYQNHTLKYKKFGKVSVTILKPEYWSIGKITRLYDTDMSDMVAVFKKQKTKYETLLTVWEKALKKSPLSETLGHFKKHVIYFMTEFGKSIWNKKIEEKWLSAFK